MTSVGNNIWKVEVPDGYNMVVFNDNTWRQTKDISIPGKGMVYRNGSWEAYSGGA